MKNYLRKIQKGDLRLKEERNKIKRNISIEKEGGGWFLMVFDGKG